MIKQLKGIYKVKHPDMRELYREATALIDQFDHVDIGHNLRHKNELADKLANLAMDRRADVTDVDGESEPSPLDAPSLQAPQAGDEHACPRCGCTIEIRTPTGIRPHQVKPFVCQCGTKMSGPVRAG